MEGRDERDSIHRHADRSGKIERFCSHAFGRESSLRETPRGACRVGVQPDAGSRRRQQGRAQRIHPALGPTLASAAPLDLPARIFGLRVRDPKSPQSGNPPGTIFIRLRRVAAIPHPRGAFLLPQAGVAPPVAWRQSARLQEVHWEGKARLRVSDGRRVQIEAVESLHTVVPEVLNLALALVLAGRGYQIIHGGAVARRSECAVIMGPPGAGKSSLVLEAVRLGLSLVSDEIVPFRGRGGRLICPGSNPQIRVDPSGLRVGSESRRRSVESKVVLDARRQGWRCCEGSCRLAVLLFLGPRLRRGEASYRLESLPPAEALLRLVAGTYNRRVLGETERRRNLAACAAAARAVPAYLLSVGEGAAGLAGAGRALDELFSRAPSAPNAANSSRRIRR